MVSELTITHYDCPLCGKQVNAQENNGFYSHRFTQGIWYLLDCTPCCKVWVAWLPINGVLLYVGSFRNDVVFHEWATACGEERGGRLAGETWNVEKQEHEYDDEIPF